MSGQYLGQSMDTPIKEILKKADNEKKKEAEAEAEGGEKNKKKKEEEEG